MVITAGDFASFLSPDFRSLTARMGGVNLAFENQVLVDEFFRPIQRLGISDLQARPERPFLNAAGYPTSVPS